MAATLRINLGLVAASLLLALAAVQATHVPAPSSGATGPLAPNHAKQQQQQLSQEDLIRVYESANQPTVAAANQTAALAPESRVVRVQFGERGGPDVGQLSLANFAQDKLTNRTKQSQEFETHLSTTAAAPSTSTSTTTTTTTTTTVEPSSEAPTAAPAATTTTSTTTTTEQSATPPGWPGVSGSTSTTTSTPESSSTTVAAVEEQPPPVGSRNVRTGSDVFCGEANPNGKSNKNLDRIVGGSKSDPGEFPFQVRLNIRSRRGSGICGGVILDDWHILTAAHCMTACVSQHLTTATIETSGVKATVGDHSIRSNDGELELDVDKITPHEKYDACNFYANDHDIALIRTSQPIEYRFTTDGYGSINRPCMPTSGDIQYRDGDKVIVSGWGVTRENSGSLSNILRYVQVPIVNTTRCQDTYGSRVTRDHVCAGYQVGGKDSCQGDSGGPLVRVVENRYELVGIVSFGYGCGQPAAPGVYTRVASYIQWINANL